ncbi:MAG: hypothetical protein ACFE8C_10485, partial [Promethearchaeota archaeon]
TAKIIIAIFFFLSFSLIIMRVGFEFPKNKIIPIRYLRVIDNFDICYNFVKNGEVNVSILNFDL